MQVPAGFLIQKLLTSLWIRTVTLRNSPSTLNTSGFPGTTTGGSRGRVTLRDGQDQEMGEKIRHGMRVDQRQEKGGDRKKLSHTWSRDTREWGTGPGMKLWSLTKKKTRD